ncbi:MAG: PorT family protein [Saprospiraceae bacterium]|nr:PorT family protein [Saprospiraceae bacterium]
MIIAAVQQADAQDRRFKAGILFGLNASQITGDDLWGYNKAGLNLGFRINTVIKPRIDVSMDILYSQRGSQSAFSFNNGQLLNRYNLHYIEVPIIFHYKDWEIEVDKTSFYRMDFQAGLAYGRLFRARAVANPFEGREDLLNENDISWIIGAGYHASQHHSFHFRYTSSINLLFNDLEALNAKALRGFFLTLHYLYTF